MHYVTEMTMSEVLKDPMIRQMLRADKISLGDFATLLERTARARNEAFAVERQVVAVQRPN
jgi:hypothetical protein